MEDGEMSDDGDVELAAAIDDIALDDEEEDADDSVHTFVGHTSEVYVAACSPTDPSLVATGGADERGFLWRIGQGDWAAELGGHRESVTSLAFSSDGQFLASGGLDSVVKIWDESGNLICTLGDHVENEQIEEGTLGDHVENEQIEDPPTDGLELVRWQPGGHLVLAVSNDHTAWVWDADTGSCISVFYGHNDPITCGDFTPDGRTICTGSGDKSLRIWNLETGQCIHVVRGHPYHKAGLTCLSITSNPTRPLAITGASDGSVKIVNIENGRVVSTLSGHSDSVSSIALPGSPSFPWAATGGKDQQLIIWDLQRSVPRSIYYHESELTCLTWIGTSRLVAAGCADGAIVVWDARDGTKVSTIKGHTECIQSLAVSSDQAFLVSVSYDGTARVFDIEDCK